MRAKRSNTPPVLVHYIIDQLEGHGDISCRRFFGGWSLQIHGEQFAMVMKEILYFRADEQLRNELAAVGGVPFTYTKQSKQVVVQRFISAPEDCLDDEHELQFWAAKAINIAH